MNNTKLNKEQYTCFYHDVPPYLECNYFRKYQGSRGGRPHSITGYLFKGNTPKDITDNYSKIFNININSKNSRQKAIYILLNEAINKKWFRVGQTDYIFHRFENHNRNKDLKNITGVVIVTTKSDEELKEEERKFYEHEINEYLKKHLPDYECRSRRTHKNKPYYNEIGIIKKYVELLLGYSRFLNIPRLEKKENQSDTSINSKFSNSLVYNGYVKDGSKQKCRVQLEINNPNEWSINIIKGAKFKAKDNLKSLSVNQCNEARTVKRKLDKYKNAYKLNYQWVKNQFFDVTVLNDISVPKGSNISALIKGSSSNINDDVIINYNGHERTLGWMRDHGIILQSLRKKGYSSNLNHKSSASFVYQGYVKDGLKAKCEVWLQINSAKDWYINIKKGIEFKTENCLDSKSSSYAEYAKTCKKRLISLAKENKIEYKEVFLNNKKFYAVKAIQDISFYKGKNISSLIRGHNTSIYNEVHIMYNNKYLTLSQLRDKGVI